MNKANNLTPPQDLTPQQVADELRIAYNTVLLLLQTGSLAGYKADLKQWRIERQALQQFKRRGGVRRAGRPAKNTASV